jgi:hypothetical protein
MFIYSLTKMQVECPLSEMLKTRNISDLEFFFRFGELFQMRFMADRSQL